MATKAHPQAVRFAQTREAHRSELSEDYVELILELIEQNQEARLSDIAARLGVTHVSAGKVLRKMEAEGLVALRAYRAVQLTDAGVELAKSCRSRHQIVLNFLLAHGVDRETAEADAEGIEHHVSKKTLAIMDQYVRANRQRD